MAKGKYVVIEGPEGVGKTTQVQLVASALQSTGLPVRIMREPDSQNDLTARAIRHLTQDPRYPMNTKTEVLLYNAARSQSLDFIRQSVQCGVTCLVDRNYLTTLAVQYYGRGDIPDYEAINSIIRFAVGDMEPDLTIILDAEVATLRQRLQNRYQGERFDALDDTFLERVRAGYLWEAKQRTLPVIYATGDQESVFKEVWKLVAVTMAQRQSAAAAASTATESVGQIIAHKPPLIAPPIAATPSVQGTEADTEPAAAVNEPLLQKTDSGHFQITEAGHRWLSETISNPDGNVYVTYPKLNSLKAAAAMARLSRRGDDLRITLLDEFAGDDAKDEQLLKRVITAYGDDSVQQLVGQHAVVENASQLLTKKLEWGRLAAYLEQSTRYIYYDKKDADGRYKYYVPSELNKKIKPQYRRDMNRLFDLYSELAHKLTDFVAQTSKTPDKERDGAWRSAIRAQACDAARPVLPVATKSTVGLYASGQALESLIMHLMSDELPEARHTGEALLHEARKVMPAFLERADKPERGGALVAYRATTRLNMRELAEKYLPEHHAEADQPAVQLIDHWPHNELDLLADMLYEHTTLPLDALKAEVASWPYTRKVDVFNQYMGERLNRRQRPGRALEKAHYSWDILCDYGIFRDLQRHRMVDDLEWQMLTPRYGYDIPELVEKAGLSDLFEQCFEVSLGLYSALQAAGYDAAAQYATLLGHKMRWKVTYNAREAFHLHELRTSPQGHPGYRKLVQDMHEKLSEVHPLLAAAMKFVNKGEDPELSRLAAERYTQFKLNQLS